MILFAAGRATECPRPNATVPRREMRWSVETKGAVLVMLLAASTLLAGIPMGMSFGDGMLLVALECGLACVVFAGIGLLMRRWTAGAAGGVAAMGGGIVMSALASGVMADDRQRILVIGLASLVSIGGVALAIRSTHPGADREGPAR